MEELTKEEDYNKPVLELANKKQRVQQVERRVDRLVGMISETEDIKDMTPCNRETFKKMLSDLGEDWAR